MSHPAYLILEGDVLPGLASIPAGSIRTCVTSPPYFWQRDYGVAGQLGLEAVPSDYVKALVKVFREVRRALTADGTLWLNLGDTYNNRTAVRPSAHNAGLGHTSHALRLSWADLTRLGRTRLATREDGLKEKDLIGLPWAVAFALRADGWYLRSDVVWSKPYGKPEEARDRPSRGHEYVFLLSKAKRYFYNAEPLRSPGGGNARTVWELAPTGAVGHTAGFPDALPRRCILTASEPGDTVLDPFSGSGTTGVVALAHGRSYVGVEINPGYAELSRERLGACA